MSANAHHCWAVVTADKRKANKALAQILEEQNAKSIKVIKAYQNKNNAEICFEDGNRVIWIGHLDNFKGFRFHLLWCDKDIDKKYLEQVILPMACYMEYEDIVWILGGSMRYEVLDLKTGKNITNDYNFILKPDGRIAYNDYGDEIGLDDVTAIFFPTDNEHLYIDDIGGVHDSGCGCDPNGRDCGECSFITCSHCGVWAKRKEELNADSKNNSNSN